MKRKALLIITGCAEKRFETLQARDQLPFGARGRFGEYSLADAMRLKAMLSLIEPGPSDRVALGVDLACLLVDRAAGKAAETYGPEPIDLVGHGAAVWFGAVEFAGADRDGQIERWVGWYAGPLGGLGSFIAAQLADPMSEALRGAHAVRVLALVNATAAALDVITKAEELGVGDG